jgi:hypothetical protein
MLAGALGILAIFIIIIFVIRWPSRRDVELQKTVIGKWRRISSPSQEDYSQCDLYIQFFADGRFVSELLDGEEAAQTKGHYKIRHSTIQITICDRIESLDLRIDPEGKLVTIEDGIEAVFVRAQ